MNYLYPLTAVVIVSMLSFSGVIALAFKKHLLQKIIMILVAFSTGALLGDAFVHLIPEAVTEAGELSPFLASMIFVGILIFFSLEKFLRWRHCHDIACREHPKHLGTMNLIGDAVHNFIDGVLIVASFMVSMPLGIATAIAVAAHEIPQELGDFGVLIHSGYSRRKALFYNFLSACFSILGAIVVLSVGTFSGSLINSIIPITAGGFIYISLSGLVPELHKEQGISKSLIQFVSMIVGFSMMFLLLRLE
jgi:zinc and cadmium transporter